MTKWIRWLRTSSKYMYYLIPSCLLPTDTSKTSLFFPEFSQVEISTSTLGSLTVLSCALPVGRRNRQRGKEVSAGSRKRRREKSDDSQSVSRTPMTKNSEATGKTEFHHDFAPSLHLSPICFCNITDRLLAGNDPNCENISTIKTDGFA